MEELEKIKVLTAIYNTHGLNSEIVFVYCEKCEYETLLADIKEIIYKVSIDGGYISSDKEGGYYSKCPECDEDSLVISD